MKDRKDSRRFALFIAVLAVLLAMAVWLFGYGSMTNGLPQPSLPGGRPSAQGTVHHG